MNGWRRTFKEVDLAFVIVGEINKRKSWAGVLWETDSIISCEEGFLNSKSYGCYEITMIRNLLELKKDQVISTLLGNAVRLLS